MSWTTACQHLSSALCALRSKIPLGQDWNIEPLRACLPGKTCFGRQAQSDTKTTIAFAVHFLK